MAASERVRPRNSQATRFSTLSHSIWPRWSGLRWWP